MGWKTFLSNDLYDSGWEQVHLRICGMAVLLDFLATNLLEVENISYAQTGKKKKKMDQIRLAQNKEI